MFTVRATWMRGGTSKCWLFNAVDVDPLVARAGGIDALLISAFGSEDPRQLDGVGGGSSTTSKAAVVRRASAPDIDIDYLFAQVAVGDRRVEWGSNCGNCATAIGLYALQAGLVAVDDSVTTVRMRNQNTGAVLAAEIATPGGAIPAEGNATVPGTNALGVPVGLTFTGLSSGTLLPTGNDVDRVTAAGRSHAATMVSAGAPAALFDAADLGLTGAEDNSVIAEHLPLLVALRQQASLRMGLSKPGDPISHAIPKVGIVGAPRDYLTTAGDAVRADEYDVSVRMLSMLAPHPAIGLTSAVAVAAASTIAGGVVARALRGTTPTPPLLRIGTPAGVLHVDLNRTADGALESATLHRAARRIASAELFVTATALADVGV